MNLSKFESVDNHDIYGKVFLDLRSHYMPENVSECALEVRFDLKDYKKFLTPDEFKEAIEREVSSIKKFLKRYDVECEVSDFYSTEPFMVYITFDKGITLNNFYKANLLIKSYVPNNWFVKRGPSVVMEGSQYVYLMKHIKR